MYFVLFVSCTESQNAQQVNDESTTTVREKVQHFDDSLLYTYPQSKELRIATEQRYETLDPHSTKSHDVLQVIHALYTGLTTLDPITSTVRPALAKHWQSSLQEEGYTYIFSIRDATWTDGTKVTAQQVQQSLLRAMSPQRNTEFSFVLAHSIKGAQNFFTLQENASDGAIVRYSQEVAIQVIDPVTISISTQTIDIPLLQLLAHPQAAILPIEDFRDEYNGHDFSVDPDTWVGLGAYVPVQMAEDTLTLQENTQFWVQPWSKSVVVTMGLSKDMQMERFTNKEKNMHIDWVKNFPRIPITSVNQDDKNIHNQRFSHLMFLDIPNTSLLRTKFSRQDLGVASNIRLNFTLNTLNDTYADRAVAEILYVLRNAIAVYDAFATTEIAMPVYVASSIFKPYYISTSSFSTLSFITQLPNTLQEYVSQTVSYDTIIESEDIDLLQFQKNRSYIQLLRRYVERNDEKIEFEAVTIAYDSIVLRDVAEYVAREYFEANAVPVELKQIGALGKNDDSEESYDVALRLFSPVVDDHYAMLLALEYHMFKNNTKALFSLSNTFFSVQDTIDQLINGQYSAFYTQIKNYLYVLQEQKRVVPVFFYTQQHYIDTKKFRWWTVPARLWHPLYP